MKKHLFQFTDIPYKQFQQLGIDEMEVQRMFTLEDVERLLIGKCTGLKKNVVIKTGDRKFSIDAKFLLIRGKNNVMDLVIFTRKEIVECEFGLNEEHINMLKKGEIVKIEDPLTKQQWWVQLDLTINSLFRATESYVKSLEQKPSPLNHKPTDADYYDWEYTIERFNSKTFVSEDEIKEKPPLSVKDFLKTIQAESNAFSRAIFDEFGD
jgi:Protein of unknown function (DUF4099)